MSIKEKIYIFGASNLGNKIFNLAKEYFNIIGFIDNDKNKWNTEFCGKKVYSPEILSNCKNKIFIASTFYKEIEEQLLENDFYNYFVILSESSFYSYLLINNYDVDKMIKDEYREFQEKISENNHNLQMISTSKKVLIIREMNSSLLNGLVSKLDANYIYIDILTRDNMSCYNNVKNIFKANDLFKMSLFLKNTNVYDIISKFVSDEGINDKVFMYGFIPNNKMNEFWSSLDIYINISDYEGTSIAMLEALGNGCVPVVTNVSGVKDFIVDGINGFIVDVQDFTSMGEKIEYLYNHREKLSEFGQKCIKRVKEVCSIDKYIEYLENIL